MTKLSPWRLGIAFGATGVVFYVGCMIFMATATSESVTWITNSILHGVDVVTVMREGVPLGQSLVGILLTFLGGLIFGAMSAGTYNLLSRAKSIQRVD